MYKAMKKPDKYLPFLLAAVSLLSLTGRAETMKLDLQTCRDLALQGNKQIQVDRENAEAAKNLRKAALAAMFPKLSANGGYVWNQNNLYLLSQEATLPFGTMNADGTFVFSPNLIGTAYPQLEGPASQWVASEYLKAREATAIDIENIVVGEIGITQPIYLGGKLIELYKIAQATEAIEQLKSGQTDMELLVSVDEAYWRVLSVSAKFRLADEYCRMLRKVEQDLTAAVEEGTATQSDLLKVRVSLNEAEVSLLKAENGLKLSKMALCQVCGLELDTDVELDDSGLEQTSFRLDTLSMEQVWDRRNELQLLEQADRIARSGVRIAASTLKPNVVARANYYVTNPNLFHGLSDMKSYGGSFAAGVVVNIPIAHADDILRLKAAKNKARTVSLQLEEAREKIHLQVSQSTRQLEEADRNFAMALANIDNAEENLRLAQAGFEEGMVTSTELLGAQTAWLKAYSEKIDASVNLRLYETYLKKNTGNLK